MEYQRADSSNEHDCWCGRAADQHDPADEDDHNPHPERPTDRFRRQSEEATATIDALPEWLRRLMGRPL